MSARSLDNYNPRTALLLVALPDKEKGHNKCLSCMGGSVVRKRWLAWNVRHKL
jgi:hypothetical protein